MGLASHEAAWVVELLILHPEIEVMSLELRPDSMRIGEDVIPVVNLRIHAATLLDAGALVTAMHLADVENHPIHDLDPDRIWYSFAGWAHEGSRATACRVEVITAEDIPLEARSPIEARGPLVDPWAA